MVEPAPADRDAALARECLRVYRRYAVEIVEALDFCPYAARCRSEGRTREVVVLAPALDLERALAEVAPLAADERVEVALVIWPRVRCTRLELARFVERLRAALWAERLEADVERRPDGAALRVRERA